MARSALNNVLIVLMCCLSWLGAFAASAEVEIEIEWVTIGAAGNACLPVGPLAGLPGGCFGGVDDAYRIGKFEVTNLEYAEFLNAIAATDTYNLHAALGITRTGVPGSYAYTANVLDQDKPVFVSFWSATRFANWLHNEQPTGLQDSTTTEDGAYTLTPASMANNTVVRNVGAWVFLPSEDQWFKAAFYDPGSTSYFAYTTSSNTQPSCIGPSATPNTANCDFVYQDLSDVGSYPGSASPSGTFDQGGNRWEWTDTILFFVESLRVTRGGDWTQGVFNLGHTRNSIFLSVPTSSAGFRVASQAPATPTLQPLAMIVFAGLLGGVGGALLRRTSRVTG